METFSEAPYEYKMSCKHAHEMADSYLRMITHINTYFIAYKFFMITHILQDDFFSSAELSV